MKNEPFGDMVDRCFKKVKDHMGWTDEKTNKWFLTKNPYFGNLEPDEFLHRRPDKFERVIDEMIETNPNFMNQTKTKRIWGAG